jgi:hypothetical protein
MTSGLVVSRLGIQATASDDLVHGLLCLRVPHFSIIWPVEVKLMIDIAAKGKRIESFNAMESLPRSVPIHLHIPSSDYFKMDKADI